MEYKNKEDLKMNKEYLTTFLNANEELVLGSIEKIKDFKGSKEEKEALLNEYSEFTRQHLTGIKQLNDCERSAEDVVIEYEKLAVEGENFAAQQKQLLYTEIAGASRDFVMQLASMIFYTARFREGLRFDIDNYVNDGFVRGLVQKLPDFMRSKK